MFGNEMVGLYMRRAWKSLTKKEKMEWNMIGGTGDFTRPSSDVSNVDFASYF